MNHHTGDTARSGLTRRETHFLNAWLRCVHLGSPVNGPHPQKSPSVEELRQLRHKHRRLITTASPNLTMLESMVSGESAYAVLLIDSEARVIDLRVDLKTSHEGFRVNLYPGGSLSEAVIGNNGPGTALQTGQPAVFSGFEHYNQALLGWHTIGVPIETGDGEQVGALGLFLTKNSSAANNILNLLTEQAKTLGLALNAPDTPVLPTAAPARVPDWALVLDTLGQTVIAVETSGRVVVWNREAEKLLGIPAAEALGTPIRKIRSPNAELQPVLLSLARGIKVHSAEVQANWGDHKRTLRVENRKLMGENGESQGLVCVMTDITDVTRSAVPQYDPLDMAMRIMGGFAHEVRNPLAIIRGFAQLLLEGKGAKQMNHYLSMILDEVDRVNDQIRGFISLSSSQDAEDQLVDLCTLIRDVNLLMQGYVFLNGVRLAVEVENELGAVQGNAEQLRQVLLNLVKNALEASTGGGTVTLRAAALDDSVQIAVIDNGAGIPEETLPRVFESFFTTRDGVGLGLAISEDIVRRHGGTIEIESTPGKGTTATVNLPRNKAE